MKKAKLFFRVTSEILPGQLAFLFAAAAFFAGHADLFLRGVDRQEDAASRTVRYKTKNGSFTVGGTGLRLDLPEKLTGLRKKEKEIILTDQKP